MPTVSIIIPVYKSEQYINRCIDSILQQTYKDYELLLIDDGSPDDSGNICDEYARADNRIKVIHQQNQGASAARNRGIAEASGKYLMFCDSDDLVSPMWIEHLISCIDDESTLAMGSYCKELKNLGTKRELIINPLQKFDTSDYYQFNQSGIAGFLCNAIYIRDIVEAFNIRLRQQADKGDYNEDLIFALEYASHIDSIVYTGYSDYMYDVRQDSMSHSFDKHYFDKYEEKYQLWKSFLRINCKNEFQSNLSTKMLYHFLRSLQLDIEQITFGNIFKTKKHFYSIVASNSMKECINSADTSKENQRIINLIINQKKLMVFIIYLITEIKRRCKL